MKNQNNPSVIGADGEQSQRQCVAGGLGQSGLAGADGISCSGSD